MAIKLNDKWYDESKFNTEIKNAIVQVSNYQKQVNNLNADIQNCKILLFIMQSLFKTMYQLLLRLKNLKLKMIHSNMSVTETKK